MAEPRGYALPLDHELEHFRITQVLGQGGFGITYKAMDLRLQREVAIKEYLPRQFAYRGEGSTVLPRDDNEREIFEWGLNRFIDEARTLARFRHPNIVAVLSYFEGNGTAYLVMEYEEGRDFEAWLDLRPEGVAEDVLVHRILLPVLDGLEKVHEKGLLHRDIKPENIFMRRDGTPVLIDFGASRAHGQDTTAKLTTLYSAGYSPFEQYGGGNRQGPWTDLYALAGTLYRVIAGRKPTDAIARQQGEALIPAVEAGRGRYSRAFLSAIDCALALDPKQRPQTAAAFRDMVREIPSLVAVADGGGDTLVRSRLVPKERSKRVRGPLWWSLGAIGSLLVAVALVFTLLDWREQAVEDEARLARLHEERRDQERLQREAEEAQQKAAAEEAQRKAAEEAQRQAAEEAQRKAAEEAQRKAAEEAQRKAAEEAQRKAAAEEAQRKEAAEEAQRVAAAEEAQRKEAAAEEASRSETSPDDGTLTDSKPEGKGSGVAKTVGFLAGLGLALLDEKQERERETERSVPPQQPQQAQQAQQAQQPQYVVRCVFPNDPNSYYVTAADEIISFSPNGQGTQIGRAIAPTVAGYEWMYQTASFTYGVVNGLIYASAPDGTPYQVGYTTHP